MKQKIIILISAVAVLVAGLVSYLYFSVDREPCFPVGTSQKGKWQYSSGYVYNNTDSGIKVTFYDEVKSQTLEFESIIFHFDKLVSSSTIPVEPGEAAFTQSKTNKKYQELNSEWLGRHYDWKNDDFPIITVFAVRQEKLPKAVPSQ